MCPRPRRRPVPRKSAWSRLQEHFHTHPRGRLHEFAFWSGLGLALGAFAYFGWQLDWLSTPIALMLGIIAACLFGWAFLPQTPRKAPPAKPAKSRRK